MDAEKNNGNVMGKKIRCYKPCSYGENAYALKLGRITRKMRSKPSQEGTVKGRMRVIIVGCGRVGSQLARELDLAHHDVTVIDEKMEAFNRLEGDFGGTMIVGDGVDDDLLNKAGIRDADAFAAVTNGDNRNIMAAQIAQRVYHVPHVIARIYDPLREEFYRTTMKMDTLCTTTLGASIIARSILDHADAESASTSVPGESS